MADKPATGGKRFFKLASMTASVATRYATSKLKTAFLDGDQAESERSRLHEVNGAKIVETLGELKGAVMKVGQMASITKDVLPKEIGDALSALQKEAPPMSFDIISQQIEAELGAHPFHLFSRFEEKPFASASIGQVHRATTDDGREVVVKIQYPGVDGAVDSDLRHLKYTILASGLIKVSKKDFDAVIAEVKARLHEELDYTNEAENVRYFRKLYGNDPNVVLPDVVGERSSQRVLTLTYEPGDSLMDLEELGYTQVERNKLGYALFRAMARQLFEFEAIHADPNPANFGMRKDGKVVIYDFGCVKRVKPEICAAYRDIIQAAFTDQWDDVEDALRRLGVRNLDGGQPPFKFYEKWRDIFSAPFLSDGPFDFAQSRVHKDVLKNVPEFLASHLTAFKPSSEMVFVDRVVAGHYGNLCKIGCKAEFGPLLKEFSGFTEPV